jgi:hypothetical protein
VLVGIVVVVGPVEDDDAVDAIVVELPTVISGEAAEQDETRATAISAVRRAKKRIRTGMDRISADEPPGFSVNR